MADTLDDIKAELLESNVDIDAALAALAENATAIADLSAQLEASGVDATARAEILATLNAQQQKIEDALDPNVPVTLEVPPEG